MERVPGNLPGAPTRLSRRAGRRVVSLEPPSILRPRVKGVAVHEKSFVSTLPSAQEFIEFARASKAINLDVSVADLLQSADGILKHRPGYVLFNTRCGMLIIDRQVLEADLVRNIAGAVREVERGD
jgi:hypothetical protein